MKKEKALFEPATECSDKSDAKIFTLKDLKNEIEQYEFMINELRNENDTLRIERDTFKTCIQLMSNNK
jgi:prefoldin subunit 5